ncbi:MAG: AAA family ATPase [Pseudomonadota bacterium]
MYTAYFGLKENPFTLSPDPRYFYFSRQHREALNHLIYGITEKKGFIVVTGGIGTGKTTICRTLLANLDDAIESALIFNSAITDVELLETIHQEFHLSLNGREKTKKRYIDALNEFLLKCFAAGKNVVLLIDEAQNLSCDVLEQLRMLSNLETEREKLIQIVLIGQPELQDLLMSPALRQLNERITVRYDLRPFDRKSVPSYIRHRLAVAGAAEIVTFSVPACRLIYRYSKGIPRRINAICDRAMLVAYARGKQTVNWKTARDAIADIGKNYLTRERGQHASGFLVLLIILMVFAAVLAGFIYSDSLFEYMNRLHNR